MLDRRCALVAEQLPSRPDGRPGGLADQALMREVNRRYAALGPVVAA